MRKGAICAHSGLDLLNRKLSVVNRTKTYITPIRAKSTVLARKEKNGFGAPDDNSMVMAISVGSNTVCKILRWSGFWRESAGGGHAWYMVFPPTTVRTIFTSLI